MAYGLTASQACGRKSDGQQVVCFGLDQKGEELLILFRVKHQVREHVGQMADAEGMVGMFVAVVGMVMVAAMAGDFCLKNKTGLLPAIMVMMGDNGVQKDDCARHRGHYLCQQVFHTVHLTVREQSYNAGLSPCKYTQIN